MRELKVKLSPLYYRLKSLIQWRGSQAFVNLRTFSRGIEWVDASLKGYFSKIWLHLKYGTV